VIDINIPARLDAISELAKIAGAKFTLESDEITRWTKGDKPTEAEIQSKMDSVAYARNRAAEYPSQGDQNDMMYKDTKNSTTTHADAVEAVKTKWPKDNSGPVE
jgi:hypothetical protein